ncbi:MAG: serine/threonine protein kinase [Magnetococcales bacterium]|nr:serine/threonine protein kinase [Magnetococcales bacterium]
MALIKQLGRYPIQSLLVESPHSLLLKGWDPVEQRFVSIKTLHPDYLSDPFCQERQARLAWEAWAASTLQHPNIIRIYEFNSQSTPPFIAMEYVHGNSLKSWLSQKRFSSQESVGMVTQILAALAHIHQAGMVHQDIKPGNMVLLASQQIKIADFGIARLEKSIPCQFEHVTGTPAYMSPEQVMGSRTDARSDLFSVGVILYELLCGSKPFQGQSMAEIMKNTLTFTPPDPSTCNPALSPGFDSLLQQALAKRPGDRFQSAEAFKMALARVDR